LTDQHICGMKLNFSVAQQPKMGVAAPLLRFLHYTQIRHTHIHTLGRNPLTVWLARQRGIYL